MEQEKEDKSSEPRVALSALAIKKMKAGDADKSDIGEYIGLRVTCSKAGAKSFVYRYRSPIDNSLKKITLGSFPVMSLAEARVSLVLKVTKRVKPLLKSCANSMGSRHARNQLRLKNKLAG